MGEKFRSSAFAGAREQSPIQLHSFSTGVSEALVTIPSPIAEDAVTDKNVEAVRERLRQRAERGMQKYGATTERGDLSFLDWMQHLQDELLDAAVYIEAMKAGK